MLIKINLQEDFSLHVLVMYPFFLDNIAFYQIYMIYPQDLFEVIQNQFDETIQLLPDYMYTKKQKNTLKTNREIFFSIY
jgi:hypothetical protein